MSWIDEHPHLRDIYEEQEERRQREITNRLKLKDELSQKMKELDKKYKGYPNTKETAQQKLAERQAIKEKYTNIYAAASYFNEDPDHITARRVDEYMKLCSKNTNSRN